jgi:uncharacterized phiE125 gp8 family phage protein
MVLGGVICGKPRTRTYGMGLTLVAAANVEPITLAECKYHLRIDSDDEDLLLTIYIVAAREYCEEITRRSLTASTTYKQTLDSFPRGNGWIGIDRGPLVSVSSIAYVDTNEVIQTLDPDVYRVDTSCLPGRISPAINGRWPATADLPSSVAITFVAGATNIPIRAKQAMLLLVGHWYRNREAVGENVGNSIPHGVENLLAALHLGTYP